MKKKMLIFLVITKVKKFDFQRFDAYEMNKSNSIDFEFHEIENFVYPGFSKLQTSKRFKNKKIKIFSNIEDWKKNILKKKKIYKDNLIIYNSLNTTNFQSFKVNYFIHKNKIKTLIASNLDHPLYVPNNIINKFRLLIISIFFNNKKIRLLTVNYFFSFLVKIFNIKPNFFLKCGSAKSSYENKLGLITLNGNSRDFNMYLKLKKKSFLRNYKYGIFIESVSPVHNMGDAFITGDSHNNSRGTAEEWLKSLNNFFLKIEKAFKVKILIAPHPKINHNDKFSKLYNGREIVKEELAVLAKNCEIILSRDSTAFSYAAIYKKPAIFIYNNELFNMNKNFIYNQKKFANELGLDSTNIDINFSKREILKLKKFNKKYYLNYIKKYLSSRNDKKLNYQIINEAFDCKIS